MGSFFGAHFCGQDFSRTVVIYGEGDTGGGQLPRAKRSEGGKPRFGAVPVLSGKTAFLF